MDRQEAIQAFKKQLTESLYAEWAAQGHAMKKNIDVGFETDEGANYFELSAFVPPYVAILNRGVEPSRIPFSPGSGAGRSLYIEGLTNYAMKRMGLRGKEALSVAFAIARTHKKEGMPTRGSYSFSSTGKRTGFTEDYIEKHQADIENFSFSLFDEVINSTIESFFNSIK